MVSNLKLNPDMFRAYDIRGKVGIDIDSAIAELVGKTIGSYLLMQNKSNNVVVGMDNRPSSEELKTSLVQGLLSTGCNVTDIGLCTSPMLYKTVFDGDFCGGTIVSASHNPKEYNGFKIVAHKAYPVAAEEMYRLRDMALAGRFASGKGSYSTLNIEEQYLNRITNVIHLDRKLKVVLDTGNGIAGKFAPKLLRRLGCEVVEVFCELDGNFPNHLPNPEHEANLFDAKKMVIESGADIGIGIDGDGDRVGIIDENGKFLPSDFSIILLGRDYLHHHPGEQILIDVKSSQNVIDEIKSNGGVPVLYKTGHSLIKMKMRADNISLGGEFSGHLYVFENYYPFDDALYAAPKILEILSKSQKSLSAQFSDLKVLYPTHLIELGCPDSVKFDVMKKVVGTFSKSHEVNDIDGARIAFQNGWALLRPSNTTPYLTFRAEGTTVENLIQILLEVRKALKQFPEIQLDPLNHTILKLVLRNRWVEYSGGSRSESNMLMFEEGETSKLIVRYVYDWETMEVVTLSFDLNIGDFDRLVDELIANGFSSLTTKNDKQELCFNWKLSEDGVLMKLEGQAYAGIEGKVRYSLSAYQNLLVW